MQSLRPRVYFYSQPHLEAKKHKCVAKPDNSVPSSYLKESGGVGVGGCGWGRKPMILRGRVDGGRRNGRAAHKPWCGSYHLRGLPADGGGVSGPVCLGGLARRARWTVRGRTARHLVNPAEPGGGNKGRSEGRTTARCGEGGAGAGPCLPWGPCCGWAGPHDVLEALKRGHKSAAGGTGLAFSFPSTARFCVTNPPKTVFF